jgi:hypothetical protein
MPVVGESAIVLFNANREPVDFSLPENLPEKIWQVVIDTNGLTGVAIDRLTAPSQHFKPFDGVDVLSWPIAGTPWHLLYVVEPGEVTALILPRFIPYGVILIGLLLTFVIAQQLRQRLIVGPALALADYVKAESQERPQAPRMRHSRSSLPRRA